MNRCLADTSMFIARESGRPMDREVIPDEIAVSVITIGELRMGVIAAPSPEVAHRRLETLLKAMHFEPLPITAGIAGIWATLIVSLTQEGRRLPVNDSWIAATALAYDVPVVTQDADFDGVPGLHVIKV